MPRLKPDAECEAIMKIAPLVAPLKIEAAERVFNYFLGRLRAAEESLAAGDTHSVMVRKPRRDKGAKRLIQAPDEHLLTKKEFEETLRQNDRASEPMADASTREDEVPANSGLTTSAASDLINTRANRKPPEPLETDVYDDIGDIPAILRRTA